MSPPKATLARDPLEGLEPVVERLEDELERVSSQNADLGSQNAFIRTELAERTLERDRWRGVAASLERSLADATARERVLAARVDELERELRFRGPS